MGKSIFVTYKYADSLVQAIPGIWNTTVRDYVDLIQDHLETGDHIYKGEDDGESMALLSDASIASKLGDKIFNSSVTVVLISKGMKEVGVADKDQWIPWEVSYSLREQSRSGRNSKTNAMLGVVLPDETGSYGYFMTWYPSCNAIDYHTHILFDVLRKNMFNYKRKEDSATDCGSLHIYHGNHSYIHTIKWDEFIGDINHYINISEKIRGKIDEYDLVKTV